MKSSKNQLDAAPLLAILGKRAGLRFPEGRLASVVDHIAHAMERAGARDVAHYVACLGDGRASFDDLVEQVTVGETYFFREPDQLAFLAQTVLPALVARDRSRPVRLWSAACSTGEEAYTLAMSLEALGAAGTVLATDISRPALARAREALYGKWSLRGAAAAPARPYLLAEADKWRVTPEVRRRVTVRQLNLASERYPGRASDEPPFDVVFCRNVLIYLEPAVVARVAAGLYEALADGGWLFTAASDPPLREHAPFEHVVTPGGVFYRRPPLHADAQTQLPAGLTYEAPTLTAPLPPPSSRQRTKSPRRRAPQQAAPPAPPERTEHDAASMSAEAHYLHAVTLIDQRRDDEASKVLGRALYLDRHLVAAHFALGLLLERQGDRGAAGRAFRNVQRLCEKLAPGDPIPFAGGTCAHQLGSLAKQREDAAGART